jgi:predicted dehydrogenase
MRIVGINFDHFHMGDLLRQVVEHPQGELVGICDLQPERMEAARKTFALADGQIFTDYRACIEKTRPDLIILCPAASAHGHWVELVAPYGVPVLMEKPFAASLAEADAMVAAMAAQAQPLWINWPLVWVPCQQEAHHLIRQGVIGELTGYRHYGGNRGPLFHGADKLEVIPTAAMKQASWFYQKDQGGGSLLDYMGYGSTLGTWHMGGRIPLEVTCTTDQSPGVEVDEHAVAVIRYASGLSLSETRWGTFTDPWVQQPQPNCGFTFIGTEGTLSCPDYATHLRIQTRERPEGFLHPVPDLTAPNRNPIEHLIHHMETGAPIIGPLTPAISRIGQQIVDTAFLSAQQQKTLPLLS